MQTKIKNSFQSYLVIFLLVAEALLIFMSWLLTAAIPSVSINSMLSASGIRWMFGSFTESVTSPLVIWIIIYSMVWGAFKASGLRDLSFHNLTFRYRLALRTIAFEIILAIGLILAFTVVPHAVLLSISGSLFTIPFFMGLIPSLAIFLLVIIITYGSITRKFVSVKSITDSMASGICSTSRVWVPYILIMLLIKSAEYVIG